jgi:hypothetical protein
MATTISYTLSDDAVTAILKYKPVQLDAENEPMYTEEAWIKLLGEKALERLISNGENILHMEKIVRKTDLIT